MNKPTKNRISYLPHDSPEKAIRRADTFMETNRPIGISIMCSGYGKLKQGPGRLSYNNMKVDEYFIMGKLKRFGKTTNEFGKELMVLEIQDQTGVLKVNVYLSETENSLIDSLLNLNQVSTLQNLIGKYLRVGFSSKKPMIKTKPVEHFCFSLQLVKDFDELTKHRLQVIRDYCKSKFD